MITSPMQSPLRRSTFRLVVNPDDGLTIAETIEVDEFESVTIVAPKKKDRPRRFRRFVDFTRRKTRPRRVGSRNPKPPLHRA